ncbi:MAG: hypothetical protein KDA24_13495 [Deltaproteobacteria bacterium]|nr:hypothetical protein [Deltaproteobacteria bacterium]
MSSQAFVDRVFQNLPRSGGKFSFSAWKHAGQPTKEGVGVLPTSGVDVEAMAARIMDVDHYRGNVDHVEECRTVPDGAYSPPQSVRFYQRIKIPVLGSVHHELVLQDLGERDGWRVLAWHQHSGTDALNKKQGARSEYNVGAWLLKGDAVGYALSSAPRRDDVGRLKFAALTKGADAGATQVVQANIEGMLRWSKR